MIYKNDEVSINAFLTVSISDILSITIFNTYSLTSVGGWFSVCP